MAVQSPPNPPGEPLAVEAADAGVIKDARARQRRHRGIGAATTILAAGAAMVVFAIVSGGGHGSPAGQSPLPRRVPVGSARPSLTACASEPKRRVLHGAPSNALLSILAVLRRPATRADALPAGVEQRLLRGPIGGGIFVNYIRLARVIAGTRYWVYPEIFALCGGVGHESMSIWQSDGSGGGMGDAATIEQAAGYGSLGSFTQTVVQMLIPDGVATVTLHYPAGRVGGFNRHHAPATTITTNVVGNLMVVTIPRGGNRLTAPMTMTWRAANGHIVKTFNHL